MSLRLTYSRPSEGQLNILKELDYAGKASITKYDASQLIDELLEQRRLSNINGELDYIERIKLING